METPVAYSGYAYSPAGDKGRFALPSALRKKVRESSSDHKVLCLAFEGEEGCLIGFGQSRIALLQQELEADRARAVEMKDTSFNFKERAQQLFGFEEVPFDDSGRFVMPDYLREVGMDGEGLFFQGAGDFFLIWNPETLMKQGPAYLAAKASCRKQMAEAAARAKAKGAKK